MIATGEKTEEYREIKDYWFKRIHNKDHDAVIFRNGYSKDAPKIKVELKGIRRGTGLPNWGAPTDRDVYILQLGSLLNN